MKRRDFLKILSQSAAGLALAPAIAHALCPPQNLKVDSISAATSNPTCVPNNPGAKTYLETQAATMAPGQWKQLATGGLSTSLFVDGGNNTLDYLDKGTYDPIKKRIIFIGQSHYGDQRFHEYTETTNLWQNIQDPPWDSGGTAYPGFIGHGYQHNTIDPKTGDYFYRQFNSRQVRSLNSSSGTWSQLPASDSVEIAGGVEWLPTIGVQGGLVLHAGTIVHYWDKATNRWSTGSTGLTGAGPYHNIALLNRLTNEVYLGGGNGSGKLWKISGAGVVTPLADCPTTFGIGSSITTVCPTSGNLLVIKSNSLAYKLVGNSWLPLSMAGAPSFGTANAGSKIVATPIAAHNVILFLFGGETAVWIYRHA